jgi:hypothetical protein
MYRFAFFILVAFISVYAVSETELYPQQTALNYQRACRWGAAAGTKITTSGSSQQTAALSGRTVYRVLCSTDTYIAQGSNPTAAASTGLRLVGNDTLWLLTKANDKIAFIQQTSAGTCEFVECQ